MPRPDRFSALGKMKQLEEGPCGQGTAGLWAKVSHRLMTALSQWTCRLRTCRLGKD